jgi:hypothetical protein
MGPFLLADILWAVGMLTATPWRQPGPRFVRDVWLAPAIVAMGLVNKLTTAIKNRIVAINPSPTGICTPRNVKLSGTWNSLWPGLV